MEIIKAKGTQLQNIPTNTDALKFGHTYADHMMEAEYCDEHGWQRPLISPLHNFNLHPGAKVF